MISAACPLILTTLALTACQQRPDTLADLAFDRHSVVAGAEAAAVAAADFDGDGHQDLAVANEADGTLSIFLNQGHGVFAAAQTVEAGDHPNDLAVADINDDGIPDIVVANHETQYVTLLHGDGQGGFEPAPTSPLAVPVGPHPHAVIMHDMNGDGRVDLLVDHRQGEGVLIFTGEGDGGFHRKARLVPGGGDPYRGFAVGDVNEDGVPDIVTPNPASIGVALGQPGGTLSFTAPATFQAPSPFAVGLADLDADGHLDIITASEGSSTIRTYRGDGAGDFQPWPEGSVDLARGGKEIAVGDFNADGHDDAVVANYMTSALLIILGSPDRIRTTTVAGGEHPWGLAVVDLNRDGRDDLVIADNANPEVTVYLSRP